MRRGKYKPQPKVVSILKYIEMPVSNLAVSAGTGEFLDEGATLRWLAFPKKSVQRVLILVYRFPAIVWSLFIMTVGQIVWVEELRDGRGEVGIFVYDGDGYLKVYSEQEPNEQQRDAFIDEAVVTTGSP